MGGHTVVGRFTTVSSFSLEKHCFGGIDRSSGEELSKALLVPPRSFCAFNFSFLSLFLVTFLVSLHHFIFYVSYFSLCSRCFSLFFIFFILLVGDMHIL